MEIEEKLKHEIEKFLGHRCDWNDSSNKEFKKLNLTCRKNLSEFDGQPYKYVECTKFNKGEKVCVGIGFNPAEQSPDKIDRTNKKIINAFNKGEYKTYILLNLYPLVSESKANFDESDEKSIAFAKECLPTLLETVYNDTDADVLIFWGRTVSIDREIFNVIEMFCNSQKQRLYMTVKEGESVHCHPAYVPIEIKEVSKDNLKSSYSVR